MAVAQICCAAKTYLFHLKADGLSAMEAWLMACIAFVFAALLEYTWILFNMKIRKLRCRKDKEDNYTVLDLTYLVIFPLFFLLFNLMYWSAVYWTRMTQLEKFQGCNQCRCHS